MDLVVACSKTYEELKKIIFVYDGKFNLNQHLNGGHCLTYSVEGCKLLTSLGFNAQFRAGLAMFSFSKSKFGLIDYGYSGKGNPKILGNMPYHCWIEVPELKVIIDFTMIDFKALAKRDEELRGLPPQGFKLSSNPIVPISKVYSYETLFDGKIGHHYKRLQEIESKALKLNEDTKKALNISF